MGGQTFLGTKPIGGQNLWADKTYRRTKPIGRQTYRGQNLSADKTFRRTKPNGKINHTNVQEDMFRVVLTVFGIG